MGSIFLYINDDTMFAAVGAYAENHGFPLPKLVSMGRVYPRLRFRIEWRMQTLHKKMKILGTEC